MENQKGSKSRKEKEGVVGRNTPRAHTIKWILKKKNTTDENSFPAAKNVNLPTLTIRSLLAVYYFYSINQSPTFGYCK